jgi:hypothetical protein
MNPKHKRILIVVCMIIATLLVGKCIGSSDTSGPPATHENTNHNIQDGNVNI